MPNDLGSTEAASLIEQGLEKSTAQKKVTYDLARQMTGATELTTSEFETPSSATCKPGRSFKEHR